MLQCLMSAFVNFVLIGLISNQFTCSHDVVKYNYINKSYNFNIKLNYKFKTWKTKQTLHLLWYVLLWLHPNEFAKLLFVHFAFV